MSRLFYTLIVLLLMMFCADRINPTNKHDPEFTGGDYDLSFNWNDSTNITDSTLLPFIPFEFFCQNTGNDSFLSFSFSIVPGDYTVLAEKNRFEINEPVRVLFYSVGNFTLTVKARRLNNTDTTFTVSLTVVNPYEIRVDSAALLRGDTVRCYIANTSGITDRDTGLTVRWKRDSLVLKDGTLKDRGLIIPVNTLDTLVVSAQIIENSIVRLNLDPVIVAVPEGRKPFVAIIENLLYVPLDEVYTIQVTDTSGGVDSLVWKGTASNLKKTTSGTALAWTWDDTLIDTVTVTAINRFGDTGNTDTVLIIPRLYRYSIERKDFPTTVAARKWNSWTVEAKESDTLVNDTSITFNWFTIPPSVADSTRKERGTFSMYFSDSIPLCSLGVVVVSTENDTDSSWIEKKKITVRAWRPVIQIANRTDTTIAINETVAFRFDAEDTDSGGVIENIFYQTSFGTTGPQRMSPISDSVSIKFTEANIHSVMFWCIDKDGFISDSVTAKVKVTSNSPYFNDTNSAVAVFTDDSLRLEVHADPGNQESKITEYYWHFRLRGRSDTTSINRKRWFFTESFTDTIEVRCRNSQDSISKSPLLFFLKVSEGYPIVETVAGTAATAFIGDTVKLAVTGSDSNTTGTLTALIISADDRPDDTLHINPPANTFSDTLRFPATDTGTVRFSVTAIDNDGNVSATAIMTDSLTVLLGRPYVVDMLPDSCWIYDDTAFTVTARDSNSSGSVTGYSIQWVSGGAWEEFTTGEEIRHEYSSPGEKNLQIIATDNQGYRSDPFSRTILVQQGLPHVDSINVPDMVYITDTIRYTLYGSDENGQVESFGIRWDAEGSFTVNSASAFLHSFSSAGEHTVEAFVLDDDGFSSDTFRTTIQVDAGEPSITEIAVENPGFDDLFIGDELTFIITVSDPNNENEWVKVSWDNSAIFEDSVAVSENKAVFHPSFDRTQSGQPTARFQVVDRDGLTDDSSYTFTLLPGTPQVLLQSIGTPVDKLFVKDAIRFDVRAIDENGAIRKIMINWGDSSDDDSLTFSGTDSLVDVSFTHDYDTTGGDYTVSIWTFDDDTVQSTVIDTEITLRRGEPVIWGDTLDTLWVVDTNAIKISASDINGYIVKRWVDWDTTDGIEWEESSTETDTFYHFWDTTFGGSFAPFKVKVMDDDSLTSVKTCFVFIQMGRPVLRGDSFGTGVSPDTIQWVNSTNGDYDTLFYRWNTGNTYIIVDTTDSNGTISRFDWDRGNDGSIDYENTSSKILHQYYVPNVAELLSVTGQDNDALWSDKLVFWVFPDAAPPVPTSFNAITDGDSIVLRWEHKEDVKDGSMTRIQLQIAYKEQPSDNPTPERTIFSEPLPTVDSFTTYTSGGGTVYDIYKFIPDAANSNKDGKWRVILRDARGSETVSGIYDFTAP